MATTAESQSGGADVSESGISALAGTALKAADFGVREPAAGDTPAFAAVAASLGFGTLQTGTRQQVQPAASIGRSARVAGNIVPLRALNDAGLRQLPGRFEGVATGGPRPPGASVAGPGSPLESQALPRFATGPALALEFPAGLPSAISAFEPALQPGATLPRVLAAVSRDPVEVENAAALMRHTALVSDPGLIGGGSPLPATAATAAVVSAEAPVPLHHPRFGEAFTHQVAVMARDGVQQAQITVNPPELGPVELRIVVRNDEASVQFAAQHAAVREVLEDALPRLREQFEQSGMRLHDGNVFDQLPQRSGEHERDFAAAPDGRPALEANDDAIETVVTVERRGLIDAYA